MPLNRDFIGRETPAAAPYEVTRGDVRRFAAALGDSNPAYRDVDAARALGHPDLVAPPTFLITATFGDLAPLVGDPALGLDYSQVVHGDQRFTFHRPVFAGDSVDAVTRVEQITAVGRNELLVLVTACTVADLPVADVTHTLVSRGTA